MTNTFTFHFLMVKIGIMGRKTTEGVFLSSVSWAYTITTEAGLGPLAEVVFVRFLLEVPLSSHTA